jgi:hypothetical protein
MRARRRRERGTAATAATTLSSWRSRRLSQQRRRRKVDVGVRCAVEQIGEDVDGDVTDDVGDFRIVETGAAQRRDVGIIDVTPSLDQPLGEREYLPRARVPMPPIAVCAARQ